MITKRTLPVLLIVATASTAAAFAQDTAAPTDAATSDAPQAQQSQAAIPTPLPAPRETLATRFPDLDSRLTALEPNTPEAYFLLAEEVAALAVTDADFDLAEHLFVLTFELDRAAARGAPTRLAASACLALASITPSERRARWLAATAAVVDPRYAQPDWSGVASPAPSRADLVAAAQALGDIRAGRGTLARDILSRQGVRDVFDRYSALLTGTGPSNVLVELDSEAARWPCPECRNERISVKRHTGTIERSLCNICRGNPGWDLSREGLIATLRFESAMLGGLHRSWGAQLAIDLGAPLRDPAPEEVAPTYGVDPASPYWRNGRWVTASTIAGEQEAERTDAP